MNEKINALVKRLKKGKTRYFDEFYDLTKKAVYFTVFKILRAQPPKATTLCRTYTCPFLTVLTI